MTIDGVTRAFSQWADTFEISRSTALCRVLAGKTEQEALTTPVTKN